jgi:hypothetical protein
MSVSPEAHERVVMAYQKALQELVQARHTIDLLSKGPLETTCTISSAPSMEPKMVIGAVQCPKCGQMMLVEKE